MHPLYDYAISSKTWRQHRDNTLTERLEQGQVIFCPNLPFDLQPGEQCLLTPTLSDGRHKNISLHPKRATLGGIRALDEEKYRILHGLLNRFCQQSTQWVQHFFPEYQSHLETACTSFRPTEIEGRHYSKRHDDTRLHVDAFPSMPLQGRRILRVFSNINPHGADRIWHVGEAFERVAVRFKQKIPPYRPWLASLMQTTHLTKSKRSAYDHQMLHLHDQMKLDDHYQQTVQKTRAHFPSGSSWFVFTDVVSHAALKGQFALEQTFYLPAMAMQDPAKSPLSRLQMIG